MKSVRTILFFVAVIAGLIVLPMPFLARDGEAMKRENTVRILATIAMAKTAYAVDYDLHDGSVVTMDQLLAPRPAREDVRSSVTLPHLAARRSFPSNRRRRTDAGPNGGGGRGGLPVFKRKTARRSSRSFERTASTLPE